MHAWTRWNMVEALLRYAQPALYRCNIRLRYPGMIIPQIALKGA